MATILTKKSDTASSVPLVADLTNAAGGAELAVNTADKRLFTKTSGGTVVELGTNPSTLALPNGTANGIPYLNGSKVLTSGSALTFDGTNFGLGASTVTPIFGRTLQIGSAVTENTVSLVGPTGAVFLATVGTTGQLIARGGASLVFGANDAEQMRLTNTGLGIGTSSPAFKLDVQTASSRFQVRDGATTGGTNSGTGLVSVNTANTAVADFNYRAAQHSFISGSGTTTSMLLDSAGNLGLGVTPSVWNNDYKAMQLGSGASLTGRVNSYGFELNANNYRNGGGSYIYLASSYASSYRQDSGAHSWYTAPSGTAGNAITFTQAMTLDASGNLIVGDTSGNFRLLAKRNTAGAVAGCWNTAENGSQIVFHNTTGSAVGSVSVTSVATVYNTSSDYRLKENIQPMTGALAKVAALKPVTYTWKADGSAGEGFIAHELAEVCPAAVTGEKDAMQTEQYEISPAVPATFDEEGNELTPAVEAVMGERQVPAYQGIDVSFLVGTLTAAIQELKAEFDAYKAAHP